MASTNQQTLKSYADNMDEYIEKVTADRPGRVVEYWPGVRYFLDLVDPDEPIFEIGSGSGLDAQRIEDEGYTVQRSDAVKPFVERLHTQGHEAITYNVLEEKMPESASVFANAVFLHFNADELTIALDNVYRGLKPDGKLCLCMKLGNFEGWREVGLGASRYFKFWDVDSLCERIQEAGFQVINRYVIPDETYTVITAQKS